MEFSNSISSLHKDVYMEILARLDPRSLSRFKLVSKYWYHFISHPSFSKFYFKSRPSITGFFYQTSKQYPEKLKFVPISPHQENITDPPSCLGFLDSPAILHNSCNGLLHWSISPDQHFISNPLTNKSVTLIWPFGSCEVFACGIAFDPSISDHFKVIVLMVRQNLKSRVFSSEEMDWGMEIESLVPGNHEPPYCRIKGVFLNGFLYWELRNNELIAYHVNDHIVSLVKLPVMDNLVEKLGFIEPGCLGESGGKLHYCRVLGTLLCVWEANQEALVNSSTWVHKHLVNLCGVMYKSPSIKPHGSQALAFLDDCQGILLGMKKKIVMYKFPDRAIQEVCEARRNGEIRAYVQPSMFFPFVESLALFNFPFRSSYP